ncbi:hypothetical protein Tco_1130482 [Tanacetum coccineum]
MAWISHRTCQNPLTPQHDVWVVYYQVVKSMMLQCGGDSDPYEAIRQACLVETDTESEPFEDPVETGTPESPHTVASPTSLPDSTPPTSHAEELEDSDTSGARSTSSDFTAPLSPDHPLTHTLPTLVPFLCRIARMVVRVPRVMSPSLSASIAEEDEDEEVEESSDFDSESEDGENEGPNPEDDGPTTGDDGLAAGDESPGMRVESLGFKGGEGGELRVSSIAPFMETTGPGFSDQYQEPERPEEMSALRQPTLTTWINPEDGRAYIDVPVYPLPAPTVQTPPSPKWSSRSLLVFPASSTVPSPISSPMIPLIVPSPVASPATAEAEGFLNELGAQVAMHGGLIHDHTIRLGELSPALFERYDRDIGELFTSDFWSDLETSISPGIVEERHAWLDLAEIVASMRRGQEPGGDV